MQFNVFIHYILLSIMLLQFNLIFFLLKLVYDKLSAFGVVDTRCHWWEAGTESKI